MAKHKKQKQTKKFAETKRILNPKDGRIVKLQGDPEHPVTRGFLCYRTSRFLERQYDPERVTTPLLRHEDGFRPISWDEALDKAAAGLLAAVNEHGRHSLYAVASGRAPNEAGYMMQKLVRAGLGTSYIDNCSRA